MDEFYQSELESNHQKIQMFDKKAKKTRKEKEKKQKEFLQQQRELKNIQNLLVNALSEGEQSRGTITMLKSEMTINEKERKETKHQFELWKENNQLEQDKHRQELRALETKLTLEHTHERELALARSKEELALVTESLKQSHTIAVDDVLRQLDQSTTMTKEYEIKEKKLQAMMEERSKELTSARNELRALKTEHIEMESHMKEALHTQETTLFELGATKDEIIFLKKEIKA